MRRVFRRMSCDIWKLWVETMSVFKIAGLVVALMLVLACSKQEESTTTAPGYEKALLLNYVEQEPGIEPYPTRLIVTKDYARFDDGQGSIDYVLFERASKTIYSVSASDQRVLVIPPREVDIEPPFALEVTENDLGVMGEAPTVQGQRPRHYQIVVNGEVCYEVVTIAGLLEEALAATREYRQALAGDSAATFNSIPADMHDPCAMALNTFAPNHHLSHGLPIQEWSASGYSRSLLDFDVDFMAAQALLEVPSEFPQVSIEQLRGG